MRRIHIHRPTALHIRWLIDDAEPVVGYCTCADPDLAPLGGWWPTSFTCCRHCSKPVLK